MRILLLGGSGQVGAEVQALAAAGIDVFAPGRAELDLNDPQWRLDELSEGGGAMPLSTPLPIPTLISLKAMKLQRLP